MENTNNNPSGSYHGIEEAPTSSPDLVWRAEIVKQLFGDVGEVITDFTCAVESNILLHGRMYVTNRFLCFYSNLFGLEKKIRIPYSHISHITKENTALVIPNAIAITTFRKEYIFRSFWDRDEAFNMLKDLVNKFKGIDLIDPLDSASMDMSTQGTRPTSMSTVSTIGTDSAVGYPSLDSASGTSSVTTATATVSATGLPIATPIITNVTSSSTAPGSRRHSLPASINTAEMSDSAGQSSPSRPYSTNYQSSAASTIVPSISNTPSQSQSHSQSQPAVISTPQSKEVNNPPPPQEQPQLQSNSSTSSNSKPKSIDDNEFDTESGREELDRQRGSNATNSAELLEAFEKEVASSRQKIVIKSVKVPITVADFCQLFVVDNARYGYPKYHEENGDKEIVVTPWEDDSTALGSGREIRFLKPVAIPGMPYARAKKIQRYRRYGNVGVLVCSSTRMEDVPAADTFTVEDCVYVKSIGPKEIQIEANFDINWLKSTFFRRVIEGGTLPDVTKWLETYLMKMKEIGSNASNLEASSQPQTTPKTTETSSKTTETSSKPTEKVESAPVVQITPPPPPVIQSSSTSTINSMTLYLFIAILLLTLLFVGYEIYQITATVSSLRSQISQLTQQIENLTLHQNKLCQLTNN